MFLRSLVQFIVDSIHDVTFIAVPCIAIVYPFRKTFFNADKRLLVETLNIALLLASVLYLALLLVEISTAYFSAVEYLQYTSSKRFVGSFGFYLSIMFVNYILLPQIFWFKKMRKSIIWSLIVVGVWIIVYASAIAISVFIKQEGFYINNTRTAIDMAKELGMYFVIVAISYLILKRKELSKSKSSPLERIIT